MKITRVLNQRGFTLVELITVLGLLAVVLLIATPNLSALQEKVKLEADARQLAWILRQARQDAVFKGKPQTIFINNESEEYRWYAEGKNKTYHVSPGIDLVTSNCASYTSDGLPAYSFNTTGVPAHAGTTVLRNKQGDNRYVIVSAVIGRVRVSPDPPASWLASETY